MTVMLTNLANPDMLILVVVGLSGVLLILHFNKHLERRRSFTVNSSFSQNLHEGRKDSGLHRDGFEVRSRRNVVRDDLIMGPEVEVRRPGFFSRRRIVTDLFGRVVATHYEEMTFNNQQPRLMLTEGEKIAA